MEIIILLVLYVLSVLVSLGLYGASKIELNKKKSITYKDIGKYDVLNFNYKMKKLINFLGNIFIPGLNLYSNYNRYKDIKEGRLYFYNEIGDYWPICLMGISYIQQTSKNMMEDSLRLDGLNEKEVKKHIDLAMKENNHKFITDKVYADIEASQDAIDFLEEFEINGELKLTQKQKIKLLREYRKAFLNDSKETMKPIQKTLKFNNMNKN